MSLKIEVLKSGEMAPVLPDLARLRIEVFRAFPYLYDGDFDYEERYLRQFSKADGAVIVIARDGDDRIVGASTGAPLAEVEDAFAVPFRERGIDPATVFYCAESVLLEECRGQGVGHAFFDRREEQARQLGKAICCFCSVIRPDDHPARPDGYRPLDGFWTKRGYTPLDGATVAFDWKDRGDRQETTKRLQVWSRQL